MKSFSIFSLFRRAAIERILCCTCGRPALQTLIPLLGLSATFFFSGWLADGFAGLLPKNLGSKHPERCKQSVHFHVQERNLTASTIRNASPFYHSRQVARCIFFSPRVLG